MTGKLMKESRFIPILTTEAGRCLTLANWQDVGTKIVAYDLAALLMKPGFELLNSLPDLATYTGWQDGVVLNASVPEIDREGGYTLRSEYDGSRRRYSLIDILILIAQLKPQLAIMPQGIHQHDKLAWKILPDTVLPFFQPGELPESTERPYGVYFNYDARTSLTTLIQRIHTYEGIPCYVTGELSISVMQELARLGVHYLASDIPARDAYQGRVYGANGIVSLTEGAQRLNFDVIDEQCHCPVCKQALTRAYLHHLYEHTPLLCQRFLIQHNVCFAHLRQLEIPISCDANFQGD